MSLRNPLCALLPLLIAVALAHGQNHEEGHHTRHMPGGAAKPGTEITHEEAIKSSRAQFAALRKKHSRHGHLGRELAFLTAVESDFIVRLGRLKPAALTAEEVDRVGGMIDTQLIYSDKTRDLITHDTKIPAEIQKKLIEAIMHGSKAADLADRGILPERLVGPLSALEQEIDGEMRGHQAVLSALHDSIFRASRSPGPNVPDGGWVIPTPPPGSMDNIVDGNPASPDAAELDARDKLLKGDLKGGLAALNKAIDLGGTSGAHTLRGELRYQDGDMAGAARDGRAALAMDPGNKDALGLVKYAEDRRTAGSTNVGSLEAPRGAGAAEGGVRAGGGFAGSGGKVLGLTDANVPASRQSVRDAARALKLGDARGALEAARRAAKLNPRSAAADLFMARALGQLGDHAGALKAADQGLSKEAADSALLEQKAYAQNRLGAYRDAIASARQAIAADPHNARAYVDMAYAYGKLGNKEEMLESMRRAAELDPRFQRAAERAETLELPTDKDLLFLFGEGQGGVGSAPADGAVRSRRFTLIAAAAGAGGLLIGLGLLGALFGPLRDAAKSLFTRRQGPAVSPMAAQPTPALAAAPAPGLLRGQYELLKQIGVGGMGLVYEGKDRSLGRRVAIKKMRDELKLNPRERERFIIEAKTVAALRHPAIVDIFAIVEDGDDCYLVFEYVPGKTVHELVQHAGRLAPAEAARLTRSMAEALGYAHSRGVIHRDMKPSNVMLDEDGRVKVMDFGIARMGKDAASRYSMTNTVVGTPPYMAPEQEQGQVRKESDVYALSVCAYEMLTGKLPFIGQGAGMLMNKINMSYIPPARAIAGLPPALDEVFLKAFQADPEKRFRAPAEFSAALDAALGGIARQA